MKYKGYMIYEHISGDGTWVVYIPNGCVVGTPLDSKDEAKAYVDKLEAED